MIRRMDCMIVVLATLLCLAGTQLQADETWDVVVYGGTSGAVTAAVQAKQMGKSVIVVSPDKHLGGLSSGGLGWTDTGNKSVIGGLAREFYHRIYLHYDQPENWRWQAKEEYGNRGQGTPAIDGNQRTMWIFEPSAAERAFDDMIAENNIEVHRERLLDRENGVTMDGARIAAIRTLDGAEYKGRMFIDATYEGDLMAAAGVEYAVGRESQDQYGEEWNGVQTGVLHHRHHFGAVPKRIDPYIVPGDPSSGVLPRVSPDPPGEFGAADHRVQAYCFRMCLSNHPENRVPFPKPEGYDPAEYELLARIIDAGWREVFSKFDPIPNHKTDTNNHGPMSTDNIGMNYDYPEASYERRAEIIREHEDYQKGLMYFLANDPRVPEDLRERMSEWGLAKDEFTDNGNWPHQIYVREARRMVGAYVMTENELLKRRPTPQSVGMGSYTMDSHNVQRYITPEGYVQNEGDIGVKTSGPYEIAYGALTPKAEQCENLLVPVAVSSSHIAFGSIRMEPVFMILGQSAATAASIALDEGISVQEVDYDVLRKQLLKDGQVLEYDGPAANTIWIDAKQLPGIVIDDDAAERTGNWQTSSSQPPWLGYAYRHDGNSHKGQMSARYTAKLTPGTYDVAVVYSPSSNRATNVPIKVEHADGQAEYTLNQKTPVKKEKPYTILGRHAFGEKGVVTISNAGTNGHVIADAVLFIPVE